MIDRIFGIKLGMTQIFVGGKAIPVSVLKTSPCKIIEKKDIEKDGYKSVKIGFKEIKEKKLTKPLLGYFKKHSVTPFKYLREIRTDKTDDLDIGNSVGSEIFEVGEYVDVIGISKGKGFQGIMKRYGARGGPGSHGSMFHRAPGSIGASSDPSRVLKGTSMPGRMGGDRVTAKNLTVVKVDKDKNLVLVEGSVPGSKNGLIIIKKTGKKKRIVKPDPLGARKPGSQVKQKGKPAKQEPAAKDTKAQKQEAKK